MNTKLLMTLNMNAAHAQLQMTALATRAASVIQQIGSLECEMWENNRIGLTQMALSARQERDNRKAELRSIQDEMDSLAATTRSEAFAAISNKDDEERDFVSDDNEDE